MKLSLAVLATLAATASASPIRIITLTGAPIDSVHSSESSAAHDGRPIDLPMRILPAEATQPMRKPCHGAKQPASYMPGPLADLFSRLGFAPREKGSHSHWEVVQAVKEEEKSHRLVEAWKHRVEEMMHDAEDKVVPVMEGGMVKILPMLKEDGEMMTTEEVIGKHQQHHQDDERNHRTAMWKSLEGKGGVRKFHHHGSQGYQAHHKGRTFGCRLNRALRAMTPTESMTLAFVLGAGIGSILHFFFMLVLLSIRFFRCFKASRAERRAARKARRAARKAAKAGGVRLTGEEGAEVEVEEVLPSYANEETARLVEKA